jgi:predicted dienelactone hydrolase
MVSNPIMVPNGLDNVQVTIQIWGADNDINVPYATNTKLVLKALGSRIEFHPVAGAGHFSFLAPCSLLAPPEYARIKETLIEKASTRR